MEEKEIPLQSNKEFTLQDLYGLSDKLTEAIFLEEGMLPALSGLSYVGAEPLYAASDVFNMLLGRGYGERKSAAMLKRLIPKTLPSGMPTYSLAGMISVLKSRNLSDEQINKYLTEVKKTGRIIMLVEVEEVEEDAECNNDTEETGGVDE